MVLEIRRSGGCSKRRGKVGRADEGADDLRERTALERWLFAAERAETFFAARGGVRRAEARRRRGRLRFFIEALVETKSPNVQCSKRSVGRNARIAANAIAGGGECQRGIQRVPGEDARRVSQSAAMRHSVPPGRQKTSAPTRIELHSDKTAMRRIKGRCEQSLTSVRKRREPDVSNRWIHLFRGLRMRQRWHPRRPATRSLAHSV